MSHCEGSLEVLDASSVLDHAHSTSYSFSDIDIDVSPLELFESAAAAGLECEQVPPNNNNNNNNNNHAHSSPKRIPLAAVVFQAPSSSASSSFDDLFETPNQSAFNSDNSDNSDNSESDNEAPLFPSPVQPRRVSDKVKENEKEKGVQPVLGFPPSSSTPLTTPPSATTPNVVNSPSTSSALPHHPPTPTPELDDAPLSSSSTACTCSSLKFGSQLATCVIDASLNSTFAMLFGNDDTPSMDLHSDPLFALKCAHLRSGSSDLIIGRWSIVKAKPFQRNLSYKHPFKSVLVGNVNTLFHEDQILMAQNAHHVLVKSRLSMPQLPYGESFSVNISYCITALEGTSSCQLQLFARVDFTQSCLLADNITITSMELFSEFAHCLVEQLTTKPNHNDNPRILRHQIKRPTGPRSEPVTAMHSPLTYSKSPSPSAPSPLRRSNTIVQPYTERPCTPSPQSKQLPNRASPSSLYSSIPYSEHNTPPRAAHYNPSIATTLDEDETIYSKTAGGFYNMHDNPRRGSLDTACHSIKTATSHLDHVEMYQQFHPEQTTPRALTTHAQTPDIQFSSHPSKKMFASTVIQPLAAVSGTSSPIKATTSPQTMSIVSSPAMSMMSSSLITPGSTIRPTPTPRKSNDRFSVTSETYASSERTTNEESSIPNGDTKGMKEKMMGPRPLVPARTKFRQSSAPAPAPTVGVLEGSNLKRGITLGSGEIGRRFGRKERVVEELEEEEGGIALGHIPKSVSTLRKQQVPASIQPAAEATKKEKDEDLLPIGAFELVASGSVIAVVSDKVAAPIPDVQQNQLLLSEIKSFGYESLRKRMTGRKKNAANPVSGTETSVLASLPPPLSLTAPTAEPPAPKPSDIDTQVTTTTTINTKVLVKKHKELPKKVGYRVKMPGHWVRERKPDAVYFADHSARQPWLDNLAQNSVTGTVTLSLLMQLFVVVAVSASGGDLGVMMGWWRVLCEFGVVGVKVVAEVGRIWLTEFFAWFGQWAAGKMGYVPVVNVAGGGVVMNEVV